MYEYLLYFFFNTSATTEIYTLSLHDALPICPFISSMRRRLLPSSGASLRRMPRLIRASGSRRSEEHTSELQSLAYLVCRLLLEKKKKIIFINIITSKEYLQHSIMPLTSRLDT